MMGTVLITGGNRGLGLGFVRHYLAADWEVFATARDVEKATELCALESGGRLRIERLDTGNERSILELAHRLKGGGVRLDLVINNAGIAHGETFGAWSAAALEDCLRVNVIGPALIAQSIAPLLKEGAKLVNISSGMGSMTLNLNPDAPLDAYAMSKAALNMLTLRLAAKLRPQRISVASISPGWVKTDMGGDNAELEIDEAIEQVTATIDLLEPDRTGCFVSCKGEPLPW